MKSPLRKLRKFGLNKSEPKENWDHRISVHLDGLTQAAKDMKDMRTCYDGLLSAAAATANSAYEFSESLLEMGNCLLEKTAMHDDGESGGALSMLGKVQLELQKLVDIYRTHIIMTITNPSESLLSELRKVEEMKLQCDEKREMFEYMAGHFREKGKSRHGKGDTFTSQQLQVVCDEYDDVARLCVFRVESLKQGQSRSLLTQAARHHAAQVNFFRKGLQSLETVDSHIKSVAERQHIDFELSELDEGGKGGDEGNSFETYEYGELSFDYRKSKQEVDNANSMENVQMDQLGAPSLPTSKTKDVEAQTNISRNQGEQIFSQQRRVSSHSAPIYAEKFDPADKIRTAVQKLHTHVLPTPDDAKGSITTSTNSKNLWHSSPLDIDKQKRIIDDHLSSKSQTSLEENSKNNKHFLPLPRLAEGSAVPVPQLDTQTVFDSQNIKRQAFSGPLASKASSNKSVLPTSGPINVAPPVPNAPSFINVSRTASPPPLSSPKINELHELPRPPVRSVQALGHSAPLGNRNREVSPTSRNYVKQSRESSPLPLPQLTVSRSFSIPSSSQRYSGKLLGSSQMVRNAEEVASPPLTPISLSNLKPPNSGHIRVDAGGR